MRVCPVFFPFFSHFRKSKGLKESIALGQHFEIFVLPDPLKLPKVCSDDKNVTFCLCTDVGCSKVTISQSMNDGCGAEKCGSHMPVLLFRFISFHFYF